MSELAQAIAIAERQKDWKTVRVILALIPTIRKGIVRISTDKTE